MPALRVCQKGKVVIIDQDGVIEEVLRDGEHFGMQSLLSPGPSPKSAVVLSNCDIMILSLDLISDSMQMCTASATAVRKSFAELCAPPGHVWLPGSSTSSDVAHWSHHYVLLKFMFSKRLKHAC
jgi:hypothetical protein